MKLRLVPIYNLGGSMLEIKLTLSWEDFGALVRGESLLHKDKDVPIRVKIVLKEKIGFDRMHALIERAKALVNGDHN